MEMSILCNFLIANDKDIKNSIPATFFCRLSFLIPIHVKYNGNTADKW